jgi:hypothetical protein
MPENETLWRMLPWLAGLVAAIVGVALRNEWTTAKMNATIYDDNGDLRLVRGKDCENCRIACQKAFTDALARHRTDTNKDRDQIHTEISASRQAFAEAMTQQRSDFIYDRDKINRDVSNMREKLDAEIKRLHDKLDKLPGLIIQMLNGWKAPAGPQ